MVPAGLIVICTVRRDPRQMRSPCFRPGFFNTQAGRIGQKPLKQFLRHLRRVTQVEPVGFGGFEIELETLDIGKNLGAKPGRRAQQPEHQDNDRHADNHKRGRQAINRHIAGCRHHRGPTQKHHGTDDEQQAAKDPADKSGPGASEHYPADDPDGAAKQRCEQGHDQVPKPRFRRVLQNDTNDECNDRDDDTESEPGGVGTVIFALIFVLYGAAQGHLRTLQGRAIVFVEIDFRPVAEQPRIERVFACRQGRLGVLVGDRSAFENDVAVFVFVDCQETFHAQR